MIPDTGNSNATQELPQAPDMSLSRVFSKLGRKSSRPSKPGDAGQPDEPTPASEGNGKLDPDETDQSKRLAKDESKRLLTRISNNGYCFGCASILGVEAMLHLNEEDMANSALAGCMLCGFFIVTRQASHSRNIEVSEDTVIVGSSPWKIAFEIVRAPDKHDYSDLATEAIRQYLGDQAPTPQTFPMAGFRERAKVMKIHSRYMKSHANRFRLLAREPEAKECIQLARDWLKECVESHPRCVPSNSGDFPARLLRIDPGDRVYLEEFKGKADRPGYATLTYCWGSAPFIQTTKATIESHKSGLSLSQLPRTFHDAIKVAGHLNIQYIWIDSLCIVQDSESDWLKESSKMAAYYGNSVVTISALDSAAANEGFLIPREPEMMMSLPPDQVGGLWLRTPVPSWRVVFEAAALNKRGWTLQERLLSTRVLHYSKQEMFGSA